MWRGQQLIADPFFQQRVPSIPRSATFVATGGTSRLRGVAQQLIGEAWLHAREYQYCGAIAPCAVSHPVHETICAIESALTFRFALRGVFGVDLMMDGDMVWTIELNPRLPSCAEMIERNTEVSILAIHENLFVSSTLPAIDETSPRASWG